jgi:phosphoglycolate phosphatase-like HAD superfamily hydrolase
MADCAVIFDVDGVLLELTRDEEEVFFEALSRFVPTEQLSRDWNSYRIRNDEDIVAEILERNGLPLSQMPDVITHYIALLRKKLRMSVVATRAIRGAGQLLNEVKSFAAVGIATANFREAARLRLMHAGLWQPVSGHAFGADGGSHKHEILRRVLASLDVLESRVIYVGDNVNDVIAGYKNGVHFVGFSEDAGRRQKLAEAGATFLAQNHRETLAIIRQFLAC